MSLSGGQKQFYYNSEDIYGNVFADRISLETGNKGYIPTATWYIITTNTDYAYVSCFHKHCRWDFRILGKNNSDMLLLFVLQDRIFWNTSIRHVDQSEMLKLFHITLVKIFWIQLIESWSIITHYKTYYLSRDSPLRPEWYFRLSSKSLVAILWE